MKRKSILFLSGSLFFLVLLFISYVGWNNTNPERTCASCHEIIPSFDMWQLSAHREVACVDCHGTALGNGFHSLKEKANMVFTHWGRETYSDQVKLDEDGVLEVMEACIGCHRDEHRAWLASGHSATYSDIFLDEAHNQMERPYPDCFRCHGMYYGQGIEDLMEPISTTGPWKLKETEKASHPVIPCLSCHPIHMENEPLEHPGNKGDPAATFYNRSPRNPLTGLYIRSDRMHLRADMLRKPDIYKDGKAILVSDDPVQRICMQCHAPNWAHEAGSEDDRTLTGVHEGISCRACHRDHSMNARDACLTCHPAVTSCGIDVRVMNTTYQSRDSPNNIHSMECTDCHDPIP